MKHILVVFSTLLLPFTPAQDDGEQVVRAADAAKTQPSVSAASYRVLGMKRTKSGAL